MTKTMLSFLLLAAAVALPHVKHGQCSGSYVQSGAYCVPKTERSAPAVPKAGACPSGWRQSGVTCERML